MFRRIWVFAKTAVGAYGRDNGPQFAAAISYYVLFALVPIAILSISIFGVVLQDEGRRQDVVDYVLDQLPLSDTEGRAQVEDILNNVQAASGTIAVIAFFAALWTVSTVFAAVRRALNHIWGTSQLWPFFQGKLIDFAQIGLLSAILVGSMVLTGFLRAVREMSADYFGPLAGDNPLWEIPFIAIPAVVTFLTFSALYRIVPATHPHWRDVIPGALFATVLFELLKNVFAIYVANFNSFDVVYGSLGGILLFLFFTFLSSSVLLLGAEVARTFELYHHGELDAELYPEGPGEPFSARALHAVRGLFVRQ